MSVRARGRRREVLRTFRSRHTALSLEPLGLSSSHAAILAQPLAIMQTSTKEDPFATFRDFASIEQAFRCHVPACVLPCASTNVPDWSCRVWFDRTTKVPPRRLGRSGAWPTGECPVDVSERIAYYDPASVRCLTEAVAAQVHEMATAILDLDPTDEQDRSDINVAMCTMRTCLAFIRDVEGPAVA